MVFSEINRVAKTNGLEDGIDIVVAVVTLTRNSQTDVDFTATELLKTFTHNSLVYNVHNICSLYVYFILL